MENFKDKFKVNYNNKAIINFQFHIYLLHNYKQWRPQSVQLISLSISKSKLLRTFFSLMLDQQQTIIYKNLLA